jgi:hypothetical protein
MTCAPPPDTASDTLCVLSAEGATPPVRPRHVWGPSRVGHGEMQCVRCLMTNREAWVLGEVCIR